MDALEMEADMEVHFCNNNNNTSGLPLLIQSSKQQYKQTSGTLH